jgi:uncharacterized membrane protein HdeD (DUF308 family)
LFCQACGKEMDDSAQFCPACGRRMDAPAGSKATAAIQALAVHVRILGVLWAIYGAFEILMSFWMAAKPGPYLAMLQNILAQEGNASLGAEARHAVFLWAVIFSLFTGALGLFAGWMLTKRERPGRTVALLAAFVSLIQLPFGTGLAIYTFIELLPPSARERYAKLLAAPR